MPSEANFVENRVIFKFFPYRFKCRNSCIMDEIKHFWQEMSIRRTANFSNFNKFPEKIILLAGACL